MIVQLTKGGASKAAETLTRLKNDEDERDNATVTFSDHSLREQLNQVYIECTKTGWDGEGSIAVNSKTIWIAQELVKSLPRPYQNPTVSGEPDGHVNLEWYVSPRRVLIVSVNPNGTLHWAALIGNEDPRGSYQFNGEAPESLLHYIGRVCQK